MSPLEEGPGRAHQDVPEGTTEKGGFVTIKTCRSLLEADSLRARLEAANIQCFIPDEQLMQTVAFNLNTYGYVRLQVRRDDVASARDLIADFDVPEETAPKPELPPHEVPLSLFKTVVAFILPVVLCIGWIIFGFILYDYSKRGVTRKKREWITWFLVGCAFWLVALALTL